MSIKYSSKCPFSSNPVYLIFILLTICLDIRACRTNFSLVHLIWKAASLICFCFYWFVQNKRFSCMYLKCFFINRLFLSEFWINFHIFSPIIVLIFLVFLNSKSGSIVNFFNWLNCIVGFCMKSSRWFSIWLSEFNFLVIFRRWEGLSLIHLDVFFSL